MNVFASTTFSALNSKASEVVDLMLTHGLYRIELGSIHCYERDLADALRKKPAEFLVHNYFPPPKDPFVINIASPDDELREKSIRHILDSITFCKAIGARLYTFHPGFLSDPDGPSSSPSNYDFRFRAERLHARAYKLAFSRFIEACRIIAAHARSAGVQVAVESQGSVSRKEQLLLQTPEEFKVFFAEISDPVVGINLNLGHLNLAANAFGFGRFALIERVADRIAGMEISHNEGVEDEHRPLIEGAWYWSVVGNPGLSHVPVILECRDTSVDTIQRVVRRLEAERLSSCSSQKAN